MVSWTPTPGAGNRTRAIPSSSASHAWPRRRADIPEPYRTQRLTQDGTFLGVSAISTALLNERGKMYAAATTERGEESDGLMLEQDPHDG